MGDILLLRTPIGVSKAAESSFNTLKTTAADFYTAVTQQLRVGIPGLEKVTDGGLVGNGHGYVLTHTPDYFSHPTLGFSDRLNTSLFAIYLARILAGTITTEEVTEDESWDHTIEVLAMDQDPQIKSSTMAIKLGGLDLLLGGMIGASLNVNFAGNGAMPTFDAEFVGSGKWEYMADQSPALVLPTFVPQNYMGTAAAIECSFDDGTLLDLSSVGRLKSLTIGHSNNLIQNDRRAGDSLRTPGDLESGAYPDRLERDQPSLALQLQIYIDTNKREWGDHLTNQSITDFSFKSKGKLINDTDRHEVELMVPQGVFLAPQITPEGNKLCMTLTLSPELKTGEKGYLKARVRNGADTLA
jgi:hypothetical protein